MKQLKSLQTKISAVILIPFLFMIAISSFINIVSVNKITMKLSYKVLEQSIKGEAKEVQALLEESIDSLTGLKFAMENTYKIGIEKNIEILHIIF